MGMLNSPVWLNEWYQESVELYSSAKATVIETAKVSSLANDGIDYNRLSQPAELARVAMVKLNGGLGTSMGCSGPKSLIKCAPDGRNFLDIIVDHYQQNEAITDLIFLNSFNTSDQTTAFLNDQYPNLTWHEVMQHAFKKIDLSTNRPFSDDSLDRYNPPGHGSIYFDLYYSGRLAALQAAGVEYLFISNADNLAASVDPLISGYLKSTQVPFLIELTEKFASDKKGGTVINYDGQLKLWESAQVASDQHDLFESQPVFNTNNIWVNIAALINAIESKSLLLDLILNKKSSDQASWVQLEYAMGSAIQSFPEAQAMIVPRTRFFPIKKVSDYLLLMSDFTSFDQSSNLIWDTTKRPVIQCQPPFQSIEAFDQYFSVIPSLKDISNLEIGGQLFFDSYVTLAGDMSLVVPNGKEVRIQDQADLAQFS